MLHFLSAFNNNDQCQVCTTAPLFRLLDAMANGRAWYEEFKYNISKTSAIDKESKAMTNCNQIKKKIRFVV
jgi:hypothetical protein